MGPAPKTTSIPHGAPHSLIQPHITASPCREGLTGPVKSRSTASTSKTRCAFASRFASPSSTATTTIVPTTSQAPRTGTRRSRTGTSIYSPWQTVCPAPIDSTSWHSDPPLQCRSAAAQKCPAQYDAPTEIDAGYEPIREDTHFSLHV